MYQADLNHPNDTLQTKLEKLYSLNRGKAIDLSFRPPFLDLLKALGNPQESLPPIIHVAGTNGKGSTVAMLKSILESQGYKVHAFTSPHLFKFNERIVLAGQPITDEYLEELIDKAVHLNNNGAITFFEITTAIAFEAFKRTHADIVLLEVGLGGRLDSTNIIPKPHVSLINAVSFDHMEYLGNTLEQIIREKAGIIKYETPCVVGYQLPESLPNSSKTPMDIFVEESEDKKAPLICANNDWNVQDQGYSFDFEYHGQKNTYPKPNLIGAHQIKNAGLALAALKIIEKDFPIDDDAIKHGLTHIKWMGRMEKITAGKIFDLIPEQNGLWYDGGHNDSAGAAIADVLKNWAEEGDNVHIILGMKSDKKPQDFLNPILRHIRSLSITKVNDIGPCINAGHIEPILNTHDFEFYGEHPSLIDAVKNLTKQKKFKSSDRILVCGSLYLREQF